MKTYDYIVHGRDWTGNTFTISGEVECEFHEVFNLLMNDTLGKLTQGKAVYGKPGVGCKGPYTFTTIEIALVESHSFGPETF